MNQRCGVILKPGRDKALRNLHPWIFSGAVASFPSFENGDVLSVYSASGEFLAKAYFHRANSICGRVLTFADEPVEQAVDRKISEAILLREKLFDREQTNCYRLINAEGDGIPGLIVDLYDDIAVLQANTCGIERLKGWIVERLIKQLKVRGIYERSQSTARRQEGLPDIQGALFGECPGEVLVRENGMLFLVGIQEGQKTGFFLDQREMRQLIGRLGKQRRVLNCFAYTGGFSLFALKNGAESVTSIDASEGACRLARENTLLNHIPLAKHEVVRADVFDYLRENARPFDLVILDPPAFAKKRQDVNDACRGYKEMNRRALEKMPPDTYLLSCSCSHFVEEHLFRQLLFQAALEARRQVAICSRHIQAADHPISLFHPEGEYLKSFLLHVN
jgi:23S rRNA (cytosine1962-C5)-methyltransferase